MAFINQDGKKKIQVFLKPILSRYGLKGSLKINRYTSIELTIRSGRLDFGGRTNNDVNPYWFHEHFEGEDKQALTEIFQALKAANWYDRSDSSIDYFDTAYYVRVSIGSWNKPYQKVA
jgi:hypothetical protein